ncbi:hypothetical protein P691DRAFT_679982, partial [Macrolepiota fuliginosa MF-IS2]
PTPTPPPASKCHRNNLYCCKSNSLLAANDPVASFILDALGLTILPVTAVVSLGNGTCNHITAAGVLDNGDTCSQSPVCCQNSFSGLAVIGCSPVTLGV